MRRRISDRGKQESFKSARADMDSRKCRLCNPSVAKNRAVFLFSPGSLQHNLPARITGLLELSVHISDGLSTHICERCKRRVDSLETAVTDLADFKQLAKDSYATSFSRGPLKRTKESSGEIGVSPETSKARPPLKRLTTKKLDFGESNLAGNSQCKSIFNMLAYYFA